VETHKLPRSGIQTLNFGVSHHDFVPRFSVTQPWFECFKALLELGTVLRCYAALKLVGRIIAFQCSYKEVSGAWRRKIYFGGARHV